MERAPQTGREERDLSDPRALRRSEVAVLIALQRHLQRAGTDTVQLENWELRKASGYAQRAVQLATRNLAAGGWIRKEEVRIDREQNEGNRYQVLFGLQAGNFNQRPSDRRKIPWRGCNPCTQNKPISKKHTLSPTSGDVIQCNSSTLNTSKAERRSPQSHSSGDRKKFYRSIRPITFSAEGRRLVLHSLELLRNVSDIPAPKDQSDEALFAFLEELKDRFIPGYQDRSWDFVKSRFREKAYFAVLEVVAMVTGAIPREDGGIRSPAGYLGGIFNKARDGEPVQPELTLERWHEIEDRRVREHAQRARRDDADRIRERNEDLLAKLRKALETIERGDPTDDRASAWVGALRIDKWGDDRVVFRAPNDFIRNGARATQKPLSHACAVVNGWATSVSII